MPADTTADSVTPEAKKCGRPVQPASFRPPIMAPSTWVVIGASRGIGLELVRQLLDQGNQVIAAVRNIQTANRIWQLAAQQTRPAACLIEQCDVTDETSIDVGYIQVQLGGFESTDCSPDVRGCYGKAGRKRRAH